MDEECAFAKSCDILTAVGIPSASSCMENYPHQLSGGMKQRIMIAMAIMCEPDILIADEPTTALDVTIQSQVIKLLQDLQKKSHMAILLITHDMGVVAGLADDVSVMYAGKISRARHRSPEYSNDPSSPVYTRGLFAALNRSDVLKGRLPAIPGSVPSMQHLPGEDALFVPVVPMHSIDARKGCYKL